MNVVLVLSALTESTRIRVYTKDILGTYYLSDYAIYPDDFPPGLNAVIVRGISINTDLKITLESISPEEEARTIPFTYIVRRLA